MGRTIRHIIVVLAASLFLAATAQASTFHYHACTAAQPAKVELACAKRNYYHAQFTLGWIKNNTTRVLVIVPTPTMVILHMQVMRKNMTWLLHESIRDRREAHLRLYRQNHPAPMVPTGFPPHHALWACIGGFEGSPTSENPNGHYGMLQMTYNWMHLIRGKASDYPQSVQEWAAEDAWKANGYSWSFLNDQWFKYDNADGCYQ